MPTYDGYYYGIDNGTASNSISVWNYWTTSGTSSTITTYPAWDNWVTQGTYQVYQVSSSPWVYTDPRTPEQIEWDRLEAERQADEWRAKADAMAAEKAAAAARAQVLLEENLSEEQRKQLADNNWFEVVTPKAKYRIRRGWAGNVDRIGDDGRAHDRYCIHPSEEVPHEDNMLAQKLLLEADEDTFLRIANRSPAYA